VIPPADDHRAKSEDSCTNRTIARGDGSGLAENPGQFFAEIKQTVRGIIIPMVMKTKIACDPRIFANFAQLNSALTKWGFQ
jgi:hypothetical protein